MTACPDSASRRRANGCFRSPAAVCAVALSVGTWWGLADNVTAAAEPTPSAWKAAAASASITPAEPMWMAGYASRNKPSEGVAQDLFAKCVVLEDARQQRLVIVTWDLIGVPRSLRLSLETQVCERFQLAPEWLLLNASHTHCGPELRVGQFSEPDAERAVQVQKYLSRLEETVLGLIGDCLARLQPVTLGYSHARCGFAMNRRLPTETEPRLSPYPDGPVDHAVPVLRIDRLDGKLLAVLFGYACHNTTLSFYQFCGDYAGYAQEYLEAAHPDCVAAFLTGCGGDQNPYPRGTLEQCQQHGRALANAVEAALLPQPRLLTGTLAAALDTVTLEFAPPPAKEALEARSQSSNESVARHARRLLQQLEAHGKISTEYPYWVHVIRLGHEVTLVALAGEVVVDYSLRLKRELADTTLWMAGYSNDVFGYVPSQRVLREGGYEGGGAMVYTALPGPFADDVEERIIAKVHELYRRTRPQAAKP
uniref:Neutral/alkaline non-lysosomal ceramidase N-terminal domain-containing protein n=1 Tax=Schlesneria paludicola TaxID=360056 RepID=A0A7C4LML7_9PLAN